MRIRRRIFNYDLGGRVLSERVEELRDDGQGNVEELHATAVCICTACGRPVEKVQDLRGRCVQCNIECCSVCLGQCAVCQRPLCGRCRLGFSAEENLCVCDRCLRALEQRLAQQDQKVTFERQMVLYEALARLFPPGAQEKGSVMHLASEIVQLGLARRFSRMAKQLTEGPDRDRRLLP
jgi:hypothetical protein